MTHTVSTVLIRNAEGLTVRRVDLPFLVAVRRAVRRGPASSLPRVAVLLSKEGVMQYRNPAVPPIELVQLMERQIDSLEKETFGGLTEVERREYEERQGRIDELCDKLRHPHPAA
jgi:hypothetical protein